MYLHIGNGKSIRIKEIIGIFDADNATLSQVTKKYLSDAERRGELMWAADEIPRSFILSKERGRMSVFFSPLSVSALYGRLAEAVG